MKLSEKFPITVKQGSVSAKIYQTPTSKGYASFTLAYWQDRTRRREVFADLADAQKRGSAIVAALARGEISAAKITSQDAMAFERATTLLKPTGVSLESASNEYAQAFQLLNGVSVLQAVRDYVKRHSQEVIKKTVREVVDEFLAAKREGRPTRIGGNGRKASKRYLGDLEQKLNAFAKSFHCLIGVVTGSQINEFIRVLNAEGRTKNNYRQAIGVLFEFAKKQNYVTRDCAVMDDVELVAEADFKIELFTPQEMSKLMNNANEALAPVLALGAFAGLRTSEIERLDWKDIKFDTANIVVLGKVHTQRGRARRIVPMTENLIAWLKPKAKIEGKVWPHSSPYLFELLAATADAAEVIWKHNALRHSFISYRIATINNVDQVALEAGNSSEMIFEHYRELVHRDEAKAWFSIIPAV